MNCDWEPEKLYRDGGKGGAGDKEEDFSSLRASHVLFFWTNISQGESRWQLPRRLKTSPSQGWQSRRRFISYHYTFYKMGIFLSGIKFHKTLECDKNK